MHFAFNLFIKMIQGSLEARNEKQLKEDSPGPSTLIKRRAARATNALQKYEMSNKS